ncbi:hypothetical protein [Candidatus Uabimicrobium sp. HlEnr_7]|uniref:hypothetical protein n=1 Tax=Candidatus Uabimicrobium helgolandensis TaxID=3095367 RepID=UPI003557D2C2
MSKIVKINLRILVTYHIVFNTILFFNEKLILVSMITMLIHAFLCFAMAIAELVHGVRKKVKTKAGEYMLSMFLVLLIGMGSCILSINIVGRRF